MSKIQPAGRHAVHVNISNTELLNFGAQASQQILSCIDDRYLPLKPATREAANACAPVLVAISRILSAGAGMPKKPIRTKSHKV